MSSGERWPGERVSEPGRRLGSGLYVKAKGPELIDPGGRFHGDHAEDSRRDRRGGAPVTGTFCYPSFVWEERLNDAEQELNVAIRLVLPFAFTCSRERL